MAIMKIVMEISFAVFVFFEDLSTNTGQSWKGSKGLKNEMYISFLP